jgi:hypothetical protein
MKLTTWVMSWNRMTRGPPWSHQHGFTYLCGYLITNGCTGSPGENAPVLKEMIALPFVVVPSGNNITFGHLLSIALRRIFPAAWCLDSADTRSTGIICTVHISIRTEERSHFQKQSEFKFAPQKKKKKKQHLQVTYLQGL